ncbi:Rieske 2Fe-2S domain-containing protein [Prauserella flavalba]|uniref:Rieske 2Fe-2S domain-containing protein n=1 Tax=Prauserella flavalba TaxID=1477506 RepID=UPI001AEF829F
MPDPNSFSSVQIGPRSFLVTGDRAGKVHAVFNRCSHRGATPCREMSGVPKSFQCPQLPWVVSDNPVAGRGLSDTP